MKKIIALLTVTWLAFSLQAQSIRTYVVLPSMTFTAASAAAQALGGHLAYIQSVADYSSLVANFENNPNTLGEVFFLGIETGPLGFDWINTDGTESFLNVWGGAFHIGSSPQPTGPDQVVVLRKFYSIVSRRAVYRPGLLIGSATDLHRSIVVIE